MLPRTRIEEIIERVARKAGDHFELCVNCTQSTLAALQEEFNLGGGGDILKAGTFMPGIASRKEVCGALMGGLMALGLAFGRDKLYDPKWKTPESIEAFYKVRSLAWRFCEDFRKEFDSTTCGDIRPKMMGPDYIHYDGMDPKWRERFIKEGGAKKCRVPVETAARIATSVILTQKT